MRSDVVIVGYRLNAKEPAAKALERILGLGATEARALARTFPAVVAHSVPEERAEELATALRTAGAQVELRPEAAVVRHASGADAPVSTRPEPPPAREGPLSTVSGNYLLGEFDGPPLPKSSGGSVVAPLPMSSGGSVVAPLPRSEELDLDFASADMALELDGPSPRAPRAHAAPPHRSSNPPRPSSPPDIQMMGERLDDFGIDAPLPQVEQRAYRAVQQRAPRPEPQRKEASSPAAKLGRALRRVAASLFPSVALLAALSAGSLFAVGYALDPDDPLDALQRHARSLVARAAGNGGEHKASVGNGAPLHILLQTAPRSVHAPLATILRARIPGVHQVPVTYMDADNREVSCMLLEPRARDGQGFQQLLETGHQVEAPANIAAQLREHQRALRAHDARLKDLSPLCLGP